MKRNLWTIMKEAEIFGLLFLGYGATISRCKLFNILDYGENMHVSVLYIIDWQGYLADGNKKYVTFICDQLLNNTK